MRREMTDNAGNHMFKGICAPADRRRGFVASVGLALAGLVASLAMRPASAAYEVVTITNGGTIEASSHFPGPHLPPRRSKSPKIRILRPNNSRPGLHGGRQRRVGQCDRLSQGHYQGKAAPTEPLALVNTKCMFSPRVQGAMVSEQVKISSEDPVLHNTHPQNAETSATIFNVALPFKGFSVTKPLPSMPMMIKVKCDAHEWMHA